VKPVNPSPPLPKPQRLADTPAVASFIGALIKALYQYLAQIAMNQNTLIPLTSISAAPSFVGQLSVVGGVGYIAKGTDSTSDWVQIT
jgi:hypothetical protein